MSDSDAPWRDSSGGAEEPTTEAELRLKLAQRDAQVFVLVTELRRLRGRVDEILSEVIAILDEAGKPAAAATAARSAKSARLAAQARALRAKGRSVPEIAAEIQRSERRVTDLLKD